MRGNKGGREKKVEGRKESRKCDDVLIVWFKRK